MSASLPTNGSVIVDTTVGPIEIELWSKEAPKACRNFLTLAMEGYYDGVIFHRVVPNFLVQTGDRTGTGHGGESCYGEPFEDEIHPRLRFAHRGLVGMANSGAKHSNDSQFFITLDRADELHGKHTLFGRVVGDTIFNVLKFGQLELGANERPLYPSKIRSIRISSNPYDDIVPRITAAEKRAQQIAREKATQQREEEQRRAKAGKRSTKLLSFGGDDAAVPVVPKKKAMARPDLLDNSAAIPVPLAASAAPSEQRDGPKKAKDPATTVPTAKPAVDLASIRSKHAQEQSAESKARQAEIEKMEEDIRKINRRRAGSESEDEERAKKRAKGPSYLEQELSKYSKGRAVRRKDGKRKDESDVLAALESFRGKLQATAMDPGEPPAAGAGAETTMPAVEDPGVEVDDDLGWIGHALSFPKGNDEEVGKAERDYEVIDPRVRSSRAKEEERERKRQKKSGAGPAFRSGRR